MIDHHCLAVYGFVGLESWCVSCALSWQFYASSSPLPLDEARAVYSAAVCDQIDEDLPPEESGPVVLVVPWLSEPAPPEYQAEALARLGRGCAWSLADLAPSEN